MNASRKNNAGITLLEVTMVAALMTIVMGALFALSLSIGDTAEVQGAKMTTQDEARRALQQIVREFRQAGRASINWNALPGQIVSYQIAADLDGNGAAVDVNGKLELSALRTIRRDTGDANGDGVSNTQLVLVSGDMVRVLANSLAPENESPDAAGIFGPAQDTNGNGRPDRGFWVTPRDGGLEISIQAQEGSRRGHTFATTLTEFVVPRN